MAADDYLELCPFCGGGGNLHSTYSRRFDAFYIFVKCEICGAQGKAYKSEEDPEESNWNNSACRQACNAWNMRTPKQEV